MTFDDILAQIIDLLQTPRTGVLWCPQATL